MKKRMTAILLAIAMLCTLLPAAILPASADVVLPPDEFGENTVSGTCGENLTWTLDLDTGAMIIDGTGEMTEYRDYSSEIPWNDYRDKIRTLVVGDGVTSISGNTFFRCEALTDVTVGSSVERIGYYAFGYSPALASVSLPDSLRTIEEGAFSDCTALSAVNLPNGVTSIGTGAFQSCPLTAEELPASLESIGMFAFAYCTELDISSIPAKVTTIGGYAFRGCTGLSGLVLPDGVETIGTGAFNGCTSLNSINIPDSVTSIGFFALDGTEFYNNEANWTGDVLYVGSCLIDAKDTISGDYTIQDGTRLVADYAFSDCKGLTGVTLPDSVALIGHNAFSSCSGLTSLTIPETVTSIGDGAFARTGLVEAQVPGGIQVIGDALFSGCKSLEQVTVGEGVTRIGDGAFQSDDKLASISLPASLTSIGGWAFNNCGGLRLVRFYGTEAQWDAVTIGEYNWGLENASLCFVNEGDSTLSGTCGENVRWTLHTETGVLEITGEGEMYGYIMDDDVPWYLVRETVKAIVIADGVTNIGNCAFCGCTELEEVTIPESVTVIGGSAFTNCGRLTEITIPRSVTEIGWYAFYGCDGLTSVTIPDGVTEIADNLFEGCSGLTEVTLPASVTTIGNDAFAYCGSLADVYFGGTVNEWNQISIGFDNECLTEADIHCTDGSGNSGECGGDIRWEYADGVLTITGTGAMDNYQPAYDTPWHMYSEEIETVIVGEGVTSIGDYAFENLAKMTSLSLPDTLLRIGVSSFAHCSALAALDLPEGLTTIGDLAFSSCASLDTLVLPASLKNIGYSVFSNCFGLKSVTLPDGLTSIAQSMFSSCTGLTGITIPESVTSIGDSAFFYCSGLTGITIPGSVKTVGSSAFTWCTALTSVTLEEGITEIGSVAFGNCSGLTSITLPESLTAMGDGTFDYCTGLTSITIPGGVTKLEEFLFDGCTALESVTIPDGVTDIFYGAFRGCSALADVYYGGTEAMWNKINIVEQNNYLIDANIHFLSDEDCLHEHAHPEHKDATCTEAGYDRMVCDDCGKVLSEEELPALGHDFIEQADKEPTCTEDGWTNCRTCSRCDYYYFEPVPALGHDIAVDEAVAPTCTATGLTAGEHCRRCDYKVAQEVVPMIAHTYKDGVCTVCGAKDPDYKPVEPIEFSDVKETDWFYGAVDYAVTHGLMNGVGGNKFAPNEPMTRAMLVTVLWRYEDSPEEGENIFTDVPDDAWYAKAVAWAAKNGIVGGVGNGKFDPNGNITREQMAAILYRYAQKKGLDTSAHGDLSGFPDRAKVSEWATEAIVWAVGAGIITGSDGKLLPQGSATRAQVATILMRFIEKFA